MKTFLAILVVVIAAAAAYIVTAPEDPGRDDGPPSVQQPHVGLSGRIEGLPPRTAGRVDASAGGVVATTTLEDDGSFRFPELADGPYLLEAAVSGFDTGVARQVTAPAGDLRLAATALQDAGFVYRWAVDDSPGGAEHGSSVLVPFQLEMVDGRVPVPVHSSSLRLARELGQALDDDELAWSQEHAARLLETIQELALDDLPRASWLLVDTQLPHDIQLDAGGRHVRISSHAFTYATSRLAGIGEQRGRVSSRRLHHAVVRWATDEGRALPHVEQLLEDRFGSSLQIDDYETLTASTTRETAGRFQEFRPTELLAILNQFEELPEGMRRVPGLTFLVRRLDGTPHPIHKQAPAVSWPSLDAGYIEFMERAFTGSSLEHMQRLILHEKAHFLWARVFPEDVKRSWIELGQWREDPASRSGWSTPLTTEFASAYAHLLNPDEDMAESLAWYVVDPDKLASRSPAKHAFVRDQIMEGRQYISRLRDDLVFQVENETPDYSYPGPVESVEVVVQGEPEEDKLATVQIELSSSGEQQDAQGAVLRVVNEAGVMEDLRLTPVDEAGEPVASGHVLRGSLELSRYVKSGFWFPVQMITTDAVGNERFERGADFGWRMFVESPLEDTDPPGYVAGSLTVEVEDAPGGGHTVVARWSVDEDADMAENTRACTTALSLLDSTEGRSLTTYGTYDPVLEVCTTRTTFSDHRHSGTYALTNLSMRDAAGNTTTVYFTGEGGDERARTVQIRSRDADVRPPQLDVEDIRISSAPTVPDEPNGETRVTIQYRARDDKSGLGQVSFQLRDPQGIEHHHYHYHENFHGEDFDGDPAAWQDYEVEIVLPVGSAPGAWGLSSMNLEDKAGNSEAHDLTETLQFELVDG